MSAKPVNDLNYGTRVYVLGVYRGIHRGYSIGGPPKNPISQKKNPRKIHLLEVPYQVISGPEFGPRGPGGVRDPFSLAH